MIAVFKVQGLFALVCLVPAIIFGFPAPVLISLGIVLVARQLALRFLVRPLEADAAVANASDVAERLRLLQRTDIGLLASCGFSSAHESAALRAIDDPVALAIVDDLVARAGDDARLRASALALRATLRAAQAPPAEAGEEYEADLAALEAIPERSPTSRVRALVMQVLLREHDEAPDERFLANAALVYDLDVIQETIREHLGITVAALSPSEVGEDHVTTPRLELGRRPDEPFDIVSATAIAHGLIACALASWKGAWIGWACVPLFAFGAAAHLHLMMRRPVGIVRAYDRDACVAGYPGELTDHELRYAPWSEEGCAILARIAERSARFDEALALAERGLRFDRFRQRRLSEIRAGALAALGRTDAALAELERLPRSHSGHGATALRIPLFAAARAGDVAEAARVVRNAPPAALFFRDVVLAAIAVALDEADAEKLAQLVALLDADAVTRRWVTALAPSFVEDARLLARVRGVRAQA